MALKHTGRSVSDLTAHLVLTTKYRRKVFNEEMVIRLEEIIKELLIKWNCECLEFNSEDNHCHLLFKYYPQLQLSKLVNNLKTVSSRYLKKDFPDRIKAAYPKHSNPSLWNGSYYISSTGGANIETLKKYIQDQNRPTNNQS